MSRLLYGADTQGPTILAGRFVGGASLTFWTSAALSTPITDLLNSIGGAVTSVTSNVDGTVPQFSGPTTGQGSSSAPGMWVSGGGLEPLWYYPQQLGPGGVGIVDNGDGTLTLTPGTVGGGGSGGSGFTMVDTVQTASFNAAANKGYDVNTTGGAVTATLEAAPADATVNYFNVATFGAGNSLTVVAGSGDTVEAAVTLSIGVGQFVIVQYDASTKIWRKTSQHTPTSFLATLATGGTFAVSPTAPTPTAGDNTTKLATMAALQTAVGGVATVPGLLVLATTTTAGPLIPARHNPVDATAGTVAMTLPTGSAGGTALSAEKFDSTINPVTVTGSIRGVGSSTVNLVLQHETVEWIADSAGSWWPVAGHKTLSSITEVDTGAWATATVYLYARIAEYLGVLYKCVKPHLSGVFLTDRDTNLYWVKSGIAPDSAAALPTDAPGVLTDDGVGNLSWAPPSVTLRELLYRPTGAVVETYSRMQPTSATNVSLVSGTAYCAGVPLIAGQTVTNLLWRTGSVGSTTTTHHWSAVLDASGNVLAISTDKTTTTIAATSSISYAMGTPYPVTATGLYYFAWCVVATTPPNCVTPIFEADFMGVAGADPIMYTTGRTTPPSVGSPIGGTLTTTGVTVWPWGYAT